MNPMTETKVETMTPSKKITAMAVALVVAMATLALSAGPAAAADQRTVELIHDNEWHTGTSFLGRAHEYPEHCGHKNIRIRVRFRYKISGNTLTVKWVKVKNRTNSNSSALSVDHVSSSSGFGGNIYNTPILHKGEVWKVQDNYGNTWGYSESFQSGSDYLEVRVSDGPSAACTLYGVTWFTTSPPCLPGDMIC